MTGSSLGRTNCRRSSLLGKRAENVSSILGNVMQQTVVLNVTPRLLHDTLAMALRNAGSFRVVEVDDATPLSAHRADIAIVTGPRRGGLRPSVVVELPESDGWSGGAWIEVEGLRRPAVLPTMAALVAVLRDPRATGDEFTTVVTAARAGEQWALSRLYRDVNPRLVRYLRSIAPTEADDLAADVWVAVAQGLRRFVGDEPAFRGWVFAIARNRVAGHYRTAARRRTEPTPLEALEELDGGSDVAEDALRSLPADHAVDRLLAGLPADMAEVVRLRVVAQMDTAAVAEAMGKSEVAVRVLQHRALRRLASRWRSLQTAGSL